MMNSTTDTPSPSGNRLRKTTRKKSHKTIIPPELKEQIDKLLFGLPVEKNKPSLTSHTLDYIEHYVGEQLRSYALVGFTYDNKPIKIINCTTPLDQIGVDGLIFQLATEQAAINNILTKQNIQQYFNPSQDYE